MEFNDEIRGNFATVSRKLEKKKLVTDEQAGHEKEKLHLMICKQFFSLCETFN